MAECLWSSPRWNSVMTPSWPIRDGYTVSEVAQSTGCIARSVHTWLARDEEGGLSALAEQSHRPKTSPLQMAPRMEASVLELRRHHPFWGQVAPASPARAGRRRAPVPSLSGIFAPYSPQPDRAHGRAQEAPDLQTLGTGPARWSCGRWTSSAECS